ncbi:MAG TPA: exodeoxyribonuclease VII small subunit [Chloroflexia bacterium]|nr:exodeoxyribonuclease VII small subunit [Chloroflexia bacterium]
MTANSNKVGAHGKNSASFEESFARLQEVVAKLSAGNLSLQEALGAFEEGMALADRCAQMLDEAELRVKQVSDKAAHAGSASLVGLDEEMRGGLISAGPGKDQFVLEIETYETTLVQEQASKPQPAGNGKSRAEQAPAPSSDLDPLFDDED